MRSGSEEWTGSSLRFSRVTPFPWELSPHLNNERLWRLAKNPSSAASFHFPILGGSHQPLDRQIRYYSEAERRASLGEKRR